MGSEVASFCLAILRGEITVEVINNTYIVLIPKISKPKSITQLRPISLCNVLYNIIAKAIVNQMSCLLDACISEVQCAFIPNRQISDNTIIAYELLHVLKYRKWGRKGNFALKLDMCKAYDKVEWDFLTRMMVSLGFYVDLVTLVMRCFASVSYTVGVNGFLSDTIIPSRGI